MNLHKVAFRLNNVALWLTVYGQNGRGIGTHLWPVEEGEPPEFDLRGRASYNTAYWNPRRFMWTPFGYGDLLRNGYIPPLCGRRSASRRPRISEGYAHETCESCLTLANRSGIVPLTYRQAQSQSELIPALQSEHEAWVAAGRPTEWPLPSA